MGKSRLGVSVGRGLGKDLGEILVSRPYPTTGRVKGGWEVGFLVGGLRKSIDILAIFGGDVGMSLVCLYTIYSFT